MIKMMICRNWKRCRQSTCGNNRPHKRDHMCNVVDDACPRCMRIKSKEEDILLGATNDEQSS
jgi:hypothetical protein